jgi:hypothetical protein
MLRPTPRLLALYNVPISRYFVALCWVRYSYHSYVGEVTWCEIFWWLYRSPSSSSWHSSYFCSAFNMLRPTPKLLVLYNVPISRYFVALCWVRYSYHSYVGEVTWCEIFWWLYRSPSSSSWHSSYFFERAQPPFGGLNCYPHILGCWALIIPTCVTCFQ